MDNNIYITTVERLTQIRKQHLEHLRVVSNAMYEAMVQHLDDYDVWVDVLKTLRLKIFKQDWFRKYFHAPDHYGDDVLDADLFLFDNNKRAIRKFNSRWYVVDVIRWDNLVVVTDCPDNYPLHVFPNSVKSAEFPEELMLDYIIEEEKKAEEEV